jgi:HEPN domain-containing protein
MKSKYAKFWLDQAHDDMDTARGIFGIGKLLFAGFMCHLVIEKGLKSIIANTDDETIPPKIHDLVKLAKQGGVYDKMNERQQDFLEILLPLQIEARYPSYKEAVRASLTESSCQTILDETEALLQWINQQL